AVMRSWSRPTSQNWMAFKLKEKLRVLKVDLKVWNNEVFDIIGHRIDRISEEISDLDLKAESSVLSPVEVEVEARHKALDALWGLMK
ncbi:hypothetical protein TSUD_427020, partial [Trifolium subterraneum]